MCRYNLWGKMVCGRKHMAGTHTRVTKGGPPNDSKGKSSKEEKGGFKKTGTKGDCQKGVLKEAKAGFPEIRWGGQNFGRNEFMGISLFGGRCVG